MVTTRSERDTLLENAHLGSAEDAAGGHTDSETMLTAIESHYKWSNMKLDIEDWVCVFYIVYTGGRT